MKKYKLETALLAFIFIIGATNVVQSQTAAQPTEMSSDQKEQFNQVLLHGIQKTQDVYIKLYRTAANNPMHISEKERQNLMNTATALEVKYTLYKNFYNTPSIQNPKIRSYLEKLFQQDFISLDDLTKLKSMVAEEKAKKNGEAVPTADTSTK